MYVIIPSRVLPNSLINLFAVGLWPTSGRPPPHPIPRLDWVDLPNRLPFIIDIPAGAGFPHSHVAWIKIVGLNLCVSKPAGLDQLSG